MFVGWLVGSFVRDARCDFSKSKSVIFMKFVTDVQCLCQMSLLTFERSKFNMKTAVWKNLLTVNAWASSSIQYMYLHKFGNPTEVILARNTTFAKIHHGAMANVCTLWVLSRRPTTCMVILDPELSGFQQLINKIQRLQQPGILINRLTFAC